MAANQQFCLRWNNHQRTLISVFDSLLESGTLVDCTLAAEGQYLKAHKVVLSACSPYLGVLLSQHHEKHPILILKDIKFQELKAMLDYMYRGEVNISQEQLCTFLKAAESLQIKGLTESAGLNPETKDFEERLVKRYDRKCPTAQIPNHSARTRSPPSNTVNTTTDNWSQKFSATNFRSNSPPRIRDGSLSPTARKRRKQQHPMPSVEDTGGGTNATSNTVENHQDSSVDSVNDTALNPVSSSNSNSLTMNINSIKTENSDKTVDNERCTDSGNSSTTNSSKTSEPAVIPKTEPKFDDRHSDNEAAYEDSVEEMTIEDEEEEIDENDLSRPGPSHSDDSQNYGSSSYQLSSVNDGSSGQLDSQEPVTDPLAEQRFVCRLCGKLYQWKQSLTRHIREDRCDKGPQHACPRCGIIFKHTTRLNRHILFCPSVQLNSSESNAVASVTDSIISQSSVLSQVSSASDTAMSSFMSQTTTLS